MTKISVQDVEKLNAQIARQNSDATRKEGAKQEIEKTYKKAIMSYAQKYGIELNDANLQTEYNKVYSAMVDDYNISSKKVADIQSGAYLANSESFKISEPVYTPTEKAVQVEEKVEATPVDSKPVVTPFVADGDAFEDDTNIGDNSQVKMNFGTGLDNEDDDEDISKESFTPQGWGTGFNMPDGF
ncbi:hypothetical protein D3C81_08910 [compost metagenome]